MIAQDLRDEFAAFAERAHAKQGDGAGMLMELGVPYEEIGPIFDAILDRIEDLEKTVRDDEMMPAVAWLDGFAIGMALERRKITLAERP